MYKYDRNTGDAAFTGDRVKICHTGSDMDGLTGRIGGWGDQNKLIALVILDEPYETYICGCDTDQVEVVGMPVVCLKKVNETVQESWTRAWDTVINDSDDQLFGHLYGQPEPEKNRSIRVDADGYTVWEGGNYRPVDKDVVVAVKVRGKIPRGPVPAGMWPQICWMHRHKDDEMNKWDIVAYKVLK